LIIIDENHLQLGAIGALEFWVRLRVPMEQAFRLLKEKMKAQGYLAPNTDRPGKSSDDTQSRRHLDSNMNELTIAILNCSDVRPTVNGEIHLCC
jgi:protein fantom